MHTTTRSRSLYHDLGGEEDYVQAEADENARSEFDSESGAAGVMTATQFCNGMFELVDLHTPDMEAASYHEMLERLLMNFKRWAGLLDGSGGGLPQDDDDGGGCSGSLQRNGTDDSGASLQAEGVASSSADRSGRDNSPVALRLPSSDSAPPAPPGTAEGGHRLSDGCVD